MGQGEGHREIGGRPRTSHKQNGADIAVRPVFFFRTRIMRCGAGPGDYRRPYIAPPMAAIIMLAMTAPMTAPMMAANTIAQRIDTMT